MTQDRIEKLIQQLGLSDAQARTLRAFLSSNETEPPLHREQPEASGAMKALPLETFVPPTLEDSSPGESSTMDRADAYAFDEEDAETFDFLEQLARSPAPLDNQNSEDFVKVQATPPKKKMLGRYLDLGLLGLGGMGEVRRVRDEVLKRTLAMKIIHKKLMGNRGVVSRFIEEAQVGAQLQHPNLIPVHELGQLPDGRYYFTMKQIQGQEFTTKIQEVHAASTEESWLPAPDGTTFRQLIQTFQKVCLTVAFAHSKGVVHRDLKPENIMIGGFGEVLIVDWGIAKVMGRDQAEDWEQAVETDRSVDNYMATRMGSVAGTPCYMAPEQAKGLTNEIGFHSDTYTLGAILYEVLSGQPPFLGDSSEAVLEQVRHSTPAPLISTLNETPASPQSAPAHFPALETSTPKLPETLIAICERAMEREYSARFSSAEAMAQAVFAWVEGAEKRDKALKEVEAAEQALE
jgi:eukaryotic-like serine/threonine-protein kinase